MATPVGVMVAWQTKLCIVDQLTVTTMQPELSVLTSTTS